MNSEKTLLGCLLGVLVAILVLISAGPASAQIINIVYRFDDIYGPPTGSLAASGNTLYGTTLGGKWGEGTVFAVTIDGTGFTNLHDFTRVTNGTNFDGGFPQGGLVLASNTLYGTASVWGASDYGTLFSVNTNGTGFTNMHSFSGGDDGSFPMTCLTLSGNTLYGTTFQNGANFAGTIFAINTDGTGYTVLTNFFHVAGGYNFENLSFATNVLYGMSVDGGASDIGTVYGVNSDGTDLREIYRFTNDDGGPRAGLIISGNTLYGTTYGTKDGSTNGTVFSINTDGSEFQVLHYFSGSDGADPCGQMVLSGNTLYGTTEWGGTNGWGTVFEVSTDGTGFASLYSFTDGSDGSVPLAGLFLLNNTLYGTSSGGNGAPGGTIFSLSLSTFGPTPLNITLPGTNIVLTWPTNVTEATLQSTTNLGARPDWTAVSISPVIVNGQYTVTNTISGAQQFFRLGHQ
ncbi:MAG TPA: choice-of-anchor tandem repeat GloVer-containing protein [Verrucomicrobiae bacterium]|jgi:uncharacterized repeat protein (TIGR03803 family)